MQHVQTKGEARTRVGKKKRDKDGEPGSDCFERSTQPRLDETDTDQCTVA